MGSSTQTPIGLSQFADEDKPTWRGDYNGDMNRLDAALPVPVLSPGIGENITAAFVAAYDLAKDAGRSIYIRGGNYVMDSVVLTDEVTIYGDRGQNGASGTVITYTDNTGSMFTTDKTITIRDIQFKCDDPGTADFLTTSVVLPDVLQMCEVRDCFISNFNRGIVSENGVALIVEDNQFANIKTHSIQTSYGAPDAGDHYIVGNLFTAGGGSTPGLFGDHIYSDSSAGFRIMNNKFLGADRCLHINSAYPYKTLVIVTGNSMEWVAVEAIAIEAEVGSTFNNIVIVGNELGVGAGNGSAMFGIRFGSAAIYEANITGNNFSGASLPDQVAIALNGATSVSIVGNNFFYWDTVIDASAGGSFSQSGNTYFTCNTLCAEAPIGGVVILAPFVDHTYRVHIGNIADNDAHNIFSISGLGIYAAFSIKLLFAGIVQGPGGGQLIWEEDFHAQADPDGDVTFVSINQNKSGLGVDLADIGLGIGAGGIILAVNVQATGGVGLFGLLTLQVKGSPCTVKQLVA